MFYLIVNLIFCDILRGVTTFATFQRQKLIFIISHNLVKFGQDSSGFLFQSITKTLSKCILHAKACRETTPSLRKEEHTISDLNQVLTSVSKCLQLWSSIKLIIGVDQEIISVKFRFNFRNILSEIVYESNISQNSLGRKVLNHQKNVELKDLVAHIEKTRKKLYIFFGVCYCCTFQINQLQ